MMTRPVNTDFRQVLLDYLASVAGSVPQIVAREPWARRIGMAKCAEYPRPGLTTFVTLGASELSDSLYRGRPVGFELTLTRAKENPEVVDTTATAVLENLRLGATGE